LIRSLHRSNVLKGGPFEHSPYPRTEIEWTVDPNRQADTSHIVCS
jgi:hypothetical protein